MNVTVNKKMVEALGYENFEKFGLGEKEWSWKDDKTFGLARFKDADLEALRSLLAGNKKIDGTHELARDIQTWLSAKKDIHGAKPKNVKAFESLLSLYLLDVEGHRVYKKNRDDKLAMLVMKGKSEARISATDIEFVERFRPWSK